MKKRVSATKLYRLWESIKARCYNSKRKDYPNYGGRGITVCKEWFCFDVFKNWALENGYNPGLEIDRINNDGIYCPDNCRFVTHSENNRNKRIRRDNITGYKGVTRHKQTGKYNYEIQIDGIRYRKSGFLTAKEAYNARLVKVEQIKSML